ncbi:class I SAM-dependent methyltransferase [Phenylobacterium sp.]|jgi:predicted methyltransferase|uniref:class I SAM-dependent methyltransferase n=1 Tax=Phenylobacterium sp. TaxID=1871053 RepID=UPI002F93D653
MNATRRAASILAALAVTAAGGAAVAAQVPAHVAAALADKARPEADVKRDAARKPGEMLAFGEVKPGQKVVDLVMGGGYFTRLLSAAVGPNGRVYAYQPTEFVQFQASYGENLKKVAAERANVTPIQATFGEMDLPDGVDLVFTVQNYHDLHLTPFPKDTAQKVNAEVFKSLKPGGVYLIADHSASAGAPLDVAMSLHRIDQAIVRREVEAAGFRYEGEIPLLRDAADARTVNVFQPAIRGKTDQFVMKFRKPR